MKTNIQYKVLGLAFAGLMLANSQAAYADVDSGASDGYGAKVEVEALGSDLLNIGPLPGGATGTAPAPYDVSDTSIAVNGDIKANVSSLLGIANTNVVTSVGADVGVFNGSAFSNVDGSSGSKLTSATGSVDNFNLALSLQEEIKLLGLTIGVNIDDILSLSSTAGAGNTTLWSESIVEGNYGSMTATGDAIITDLELNVAGAGLIDLSAFVDVNGRAAKNTHVLEPVLSLLGVSLILNEQTEDCTQQPGVCRIETNALHLTVDISKILGLNLGLDILKADIILGHSYAEMLASPSAVPVPAAVWLFGSGLMGLVGLSRRRQQNQLSA